MLLVTRADADRFGIDAIRARAEQVGGVPVRVVVNELERIEHERRRRRPGRGPQPRRPTGATCCTTAFVVTNGETNAITTAAHCPDELTYVDRDGTQRRSCR